ncbi:MAG: assimilatory sulfite reductase (NADPH) hemoprotein subunit [Gammaproteobacteria bacterium]|nr:assimilatory sulfite reductase (NADPH) hemoprotein subunit [Gammaproteobacteria bacterium]
MDTPLSPVEDIKTASRLLRGSIEASLAEPLTGAMHEDDTHLIKFHGIYQQDDRGLRNERRQQRLEPAYQFMIRARIPGGLCTPARWLAMDAIARTYANHTLRLTTRQTFQFHGILKRALKPAIAAINAALSDTLAACGDVNRNVMCTTLARPRAIRAEVEELARELSERLLPKTGAYHEIWLDRKKILSTEQETEPMYGATYLPRKFKIAVAVPPDNDVDVFSQDLGFVAILENARIVGFNVTVGGGLGMSHGEFATFPRVADVLGFCTPTEVLKVATAVLITQRDFGDRTNRKHARLKYTIETLGLDRFTEEVTARAGFSLAPARGFQFTHTGDRSGWQEDGNGLAHYTLFVDSGRIDDQPERRALTALREIATRELAQFHLTANQNVVLANVPAAARSEVTEILTRHGVAEGTVTPLRQLALACVGFPTCGLAMAESERYLSDFVTKIQVLLANHGLQDEPIVVRITGYPNGCARPYLAEIGLVGKAPGRYNLYLGAAFDGSRLNAPYRESLNEGKILAVLAPLFSRYAQERTAEERFGNFLVRSGIVPAIQTGPAFAAAAQSLGAMRGG